MNKITPVSLDMFVIFVVFVNVCFNANRNQLFFDQNKKANSKTYPHNKKLEIFYSSALYENTTNSVTNDLCHWTSRKLQNLEEMWQSLEHETGNKSLLIERACFIRHSRRNIDSKSETNGSIIMYYYSVS